MAEQIVVLQRWFEETPLPMMRRWKRRWEKFILGRRRSTNVAMNWTHLQFFGKIQMQWCVMRTMMVRYLLFRDETHLAPPVVVRLIQLQQLLALQHVHDLHLPFNVSPDQILWSGSEGYRSSKNIFRHQSEFIRPVLKLEKFHETGVGNNVTKMWEIHVTQIWEIPFFDRLSQRSDVWTMSLLLDSSSLLPGDRAPDFTLNSVLDNKEEQVIHNYTSHSVLIRHITM